MGSDRRESQVHTLAEGDQVGGCRIESFLAAGGMGEVYLARHLRLGRSVAVKILPPNSAHPEAVARFVREARMCSRVEHPNVITIHDVGLYRGLHYIVMQYVRGKNLAEVVRAQGGPLGWKAASNIIRLTCRGVEAVHRAGLIHRDIKPSNVMLTQESRVLLMDFGLVRHEQDAELTRTGSAVGTPAFMSPEQCSGRNIERRSDIYSLGGTYYYLLTGRPPFMGRTPLEMIGQIARGDTPIPTHRVNPLVSERVSAVVQKALSADPAARYGSAAEMGRAINELLRGAPALDNTQSWETSPTSSALVETQRVPELVPLEQIPSDLSIEPVVWNPAWLALAAAVTIVLVLALLVVLLPRDPAATKGPTAVTAATDTPTSSPPAGPVSTTPITAGMVHIPSGQVQLGIDEDKLRRHLGTLEAFKEPAEAARVANQIATAQPRARVTVGEFWIEPYEVTNRQYAAFVKAKGHRAPPHWTGNDPPAGQGDYPVTQVSLGDAQAYASWAGKQLPTVAQWMRAFRGDTDQLFPWGDVYDARRAHSPENPSTPGDRALAVGEVTQDKSPFGVYDMAGNVSELALQPGNPGAAILGGNYRQGHSVYGMGAVTQSMNADSTDERAGFRCVVNNAP